MGVHITGRHVVVTEDLRDYIERKMARLDKHTGKLQRVEVVLEKNRYLHRAEIRLKAGVVGLTISETDRDPKRAVDLLLDKTERRLAKEMGHLKKGTKYTSRVPEKPLAMLADGGEDALLEAGTTGMRAKRGTKVSGAALNGRAVRGKPARREVATHPVWLEKLDLRVFSRGDVPVERLSVEEAAERLFFADETFLCFVDEDTDAMSVIYRRKDGNFALMALTRS